MPVTTEAFDGEVRGSNVPARTAEKMCGWVSGPLVGIASWLRRDPRGRPSRTRDFAITRRTEMPLGKCASGARLQVAFETPRCGQVCELERDDDRPRPVMGGHA